MAQKSSCGLVSWSFSPPVLAHSFYLSLLSSVCGSVCLHYSHLLLWGLVLLFPPLQSSMPVLINLPVDNLVIGLAAV